ESRPPHIRRLSSFNAGCRIAAAKAFWLSRRCVCSNRLYRLVQHLRHRVCAPGAFVQLEGPARIGGCRGLDSIALGVSPRPIVAGSGRTGGRTLALQAGTREGLVKARRRIRVSIRDDKVAPAELERMFRRTGYRAACLFGGGANPVPLTDPYRLERIAIEPTTNL